MKILPLLLLILLFSKMYSTAQETVHGKVTDESGLPVSFATVTLSTKNTNAQTTVRVTDENGLFQFKVSHASGQLFIITAIGYETLSREFPVLPEKPNGILLFSLKKQVNKLSEVSISARKRLITKKIDRLVMNLGNNSLSAGKSAMEVLGMAPGVFVNNGTISISGNAGTRVMINGKILPLSGDDLTNYLTGLRAEDIEAIEVIAHPPAEYDAQGTGGMLNIILKKQSASGLSGSMNAGYTQGRYAGTDEGMRLNFNHKKLSFYTAYNFNKLKSYEDSRMTRLYVSQPFQFMESANRLIDDNGHRISSGLIDDLSRTQELGINYTGSFSRKISPYNSTASVDYADPQQQDLFNRGTFPTSTKTDYNNIGINYHISSDTLGSGFRLLADYTHNSLIKNSLANSSFYNANNELLSDTIFRNTTPSYASIYTADAGYTAVLRNRNSLSAGIKGTSTVIDNTAQFEHVENGLWQKDPEQDYIYDYKEKILAGYFNFEGKVLNTDVKLGIRGEYTDMSGNLVTSNLLTTKSYFSLFPSLFLKHRLNADGDNTLSAYYGRRLDRPSYNNLNPYESYIDNYSVARGNPYLKPSFSNIYEIGFTLKSKYLFKATYQYDKDLVSQFIKTDDQNPLLWIYTFENYGKNKNLSLSANIPVTITSWWESGNNIEFRRQETATPDLELKKGIVYIQTNQDFRISKKTSLNLSGFYISHMISGNLLVDAMYSFNIGAQHKFLNNNLLVRATLSDPLYLYRIKGTTTYRDYSSRVSQERQSRSFNLSMVYNFSLGKSFKTKKVQKSNDEEEKRL